MAINEYLFPNLANDGYQPTSGPDRGYNCVAWAAGVSDRVFDPLDDFGYYWPPDLARDDTLETLVKLYEGLGYDLCEDGALEPGYEKVAVYGFDDGYEHAARQLQSGAWTSKMGFDDDIEHPRPESLMGDHYGDVKFFLKRPAKPAPTPPGPVPSS